MNLDDLQHSITAYKLIKLRHFREQLKTKRLLKIHLIQIVENSFNIRKVFKLS